jgi:RNA polymerase sigma factor (TIGR02999 family)
MGDASELLKSIEQGDAQAAKKLLPIVYEELRRLAKSRLASEKPGHTLQATDLVHEAYKRLVDVADGEAEKWNSAGHFFGAAAEAMRRILIDRARAKVAIKRGGGIQRVEFDEIEHPASQRPERLLLLDEALHGLEQSDPDKAKLVKLRFYAGLTGQQAAKALDISTTTADRHWAYARAWLKSRMDESETDKS